MNFFLLSSTAIFFINARVNAWGWPRTQTDAAADGQCPQSAGSSGCQQSPPPPSSSAPPPVADDDKYCERIKMWNVTSSSSSSMNESVCWDSMIYKNLNLTNVTAIFQPGSWEPEHEKIQQFCSSRGNGTFCYRSDESETSGSSSNNNCLSMAVLRCPEGILNSCRAGFACGYVFPENDNVTCTWKAAAMMNNSSSSDNMACYAKALSFSNFTESAQASCMAIEEVLMLPEAVNVTTTTDAQNNTITIGQQVFGYPFVISTTVACTVTSCPPNGLPSGLPQPTGGASEICFNPDLPYDQMIPKSTCPGPYPPGPMTTVTSCPTEYSGAISTSEESVTIEPSMSEPTSSVSESASSAACPIETSETMIPTASTLSSEEVSACPPPAVSQDSTAAPVTTIASEQMYYGDYDYGQDQEAGDYNNNVEDDYYFGQGKQTNKYY